HQLVVDGGPVAPRPAAYGHPRPLGSPTRSFHVPSHDHLAGRCHEKGPRLRTGRRPPRDPPRSGGARRRAASPSGVPAEIGCILTIPFTFRRRCKSGRRAALVSDPSRRLYPAPMPLEFGVFQGASVGPRPWDVTEPLRIRRDIEVGIAADAAGFDTY